MKHDDGGFASALKIVLMEYDKAVQKHPQFAVSDMHAVSLIAEELGELAQELNDAAPEWRKSAMAEAAHVAVTAIRMMERLKEGLENEQKILPD